MSGAAAGAGPDLLSLFLLFARLSLLAVGGANTTVPEMHRTIVELHGWMDDATFAQAWALSAAAPGPNVLVAAVLGWQLMGPLGLLVSLAGILLPASLLAWVVAGVTMRLPAESRLRVLQAALVPVAIGLSLATGLVTGGAAAGGAVPFPLAVALVLVASVYVWRAPWSPFWVLVGGGVVALAAG